MTTAFVVVLLCAVAVIVGLISHCSTLKGQLGDLSCLKGLKNQILNATTEAGRLSDIIKERTQKILELNDLIKDKEQDYQEVLTQKQEEYNKAVNELQEAFKAKTEAIDHLQNVIQQKTAILEDLAMKQRTYNEAVERDAVNNNDYFMPITADDAKDIKLLRNIQNSVSRKETIDKVIWDYVKPYFNTLTSKMFNGAEKVCGIYKITCSTNGNIYIGQSTDIRERWRTHIKTALSHASTTNKLYQEMKKEGIENFSFEILCRVPRAELNQQEKYWIDFYRAKDHGLNTQKGNG